MTYYVLTEPDSTKQKKQILMRSVVKTRRKNIGQVSEYINDNPDMESFTLSLSESIRNAQDIESSEKVPLLQPGEKIADAFANIGNDDDIQVTTVTEEDDN